MFYKICKYKKLSFILIKFCLCFLKYFELVKFYFKMLFKEIKCNWLVIINVLINKIKMLKLSY